MTERHLKRRPTWYRYAVIYSVIVIILIAGVVKWYLRGRNPFSGLHDVPFALLFLAALFTLAAMSEMSATVVWSDTFVRMYARWGFKYLGGKTFEVAIPEITAVRDCQLSSKNLNGLPFSTILITNSEIEIPIRADNFYRQGMQDLLADIARLRPDLELSDNLRAYMQGEFDGCWT